MGVGVGAGGGGLGVLGLGGVAAREGGGELRGELLGVLAADDEPVLKAPEHTGDSGA